MSQSVLLTSEVDAFVGSLCKGDVILFDSLHPLSHLIKFAENRPVNHCALYLGDGMYAQVTQHEPAKVADQNEVPPSAGDAGNNSTAADLTGYPAARAESLTDRLGSPAGLADSSVTALRHVQWSEESANEVVTRAWSYIKPEDTEYNYLGLFGLMVPSLLRTYRDYFETQGKLNTFAGSMQALAQSIVKVFEGDATRAGHEKGRTLTCSEFVYRCYDESNETKSMRLAVAKPLGRWPDPARLQSSDTGVDGGGQDGGQRGGARDFAPANAAASDVVDGEGLVEFDRSFQPTLLGSYQGPTSSSSSGQSASAGFQARRGFSTGAGGSLPTVSATTPDGELVAASRALTMGVKKDMAAMAGKVIVGLIRVNKQRKKYDEAASQKGDPLADLITPRDIWSSTSLSPVAALHRLPSSSEEGLDKAHGSRPDD